jgi:UPF0716 protein FxsA
MHALLTPLMFLPLFEIIGFVVIGGEIGVAGTLLWLLGSTMLGLWLLQGRGKTWSQVQAPDDEFFAIQELFDSLCLMLAGLLLVFPGFISDFLAVPLVISPLRHWLFRRLRDNPDGFIRRTFSAHHMKGSSRHGGQYKTTIIEGEFTSEDSTEAPPPPASGDNQTHLPRD